MASDPDLSLAYFFNFSSVSLFLSLDFTVYPPCSNSSSLRIATKKYSCISGLATKMGGSTALATKKKRIYLEALKKSSPGLSVRATKKITFFPAFLKHYDNTRLRYALSLLSYNYKILIISRPGEVRVCTIEHLSGFVRWLLMGYLTP